MEAGGGVEPWGEISEGSSVAPRRLTFGGLSLWRGGGSWHERVMLFPASLVVYVPPPFLGNAGSGKHHTDHRRI